MKILEEKDVRRGLAKKQIPKGSLRKAEPEAPDAQTILAGKIIAALEQLTAAVNKLDRQPVPELGAGLAGVQQALLKINGDMQQLAPQPKQESRAWTFTVKRNKNREIESIKAVKE